MPKPERQQSVLDLLKGLRGIEPLKQLFWSELNYQRVNQALSRRGWTELASRALADDPVLFAGGGEDNAFHVIYCRLASDALPRGFERPVVTQLLREHPYALFVFSNQGQTDWHFLNVKYDDQAERRRLFRRITVRAGAGLRTATERVQLLDLAEINPELFGISPLAIQQRCDAAFDVEAVTKDFFREIANWYFWALKNVRFPKDAPKEADGHDHISVIRLITRLIFCWFVKEKGLIPDTLFDERNLAQILTGFEPAKTSDKESVFYRAILQNLFFATLNTEMDKRGWTKEEQNFMVHSLYRHRGCFSEPKSALDLFKAIPFLNGGLFECLDKDRGENAKPRYVRIDGFSRREDSQPVVPDFLFFGGEREVDLSVEYDDPKFRHVPVRGLIHIFNRYNFTVEENTPIEQEVALDPELSGKVFENLLAAYNPETGATARKQTGSFYTPREIVNYMVDEALIACLKTKLEAALPSAKDVEARLRHLFAYNDEPHQFTAPEVDALIAAIDGLKSLDPAVGSGAFPMGILHKLVFILGKLDPRNEKWKERQVARVRDTMATAEKIEDATARERAVRELEQQIAGINEAFEHNELDYGRKLYLIENCIYGVDIQAIAVQIAKMRFFISLIVDQKIADAQPNRGVRPLPNLETKFVAANTLIGVSRPGQQLLRNRDIDTKEGELRRVRERYFLARTPKQKARCRDEDARLRAEIAELLKGDGWDTATARNLASWNPYDQNASADFFDAEWMFGITDGFDVVIGNPPWVSNDSIPEGFKNQLQHLFSYSTQSRFDLSCPFVELSLNILMCEHAIGSLVLPEHLWLGEYFIAFRENTYKHWLEVTSLKEGYFEAVSNPASMLVFAKDTCRDFVVGRSLPNREVVRQKQGKEFLESEMQLGSRGQEIQTFKVFFDLDYLTLKRRLVANSKCIFLDRVCIVTDGVQTANVLSEVMTDERPANPSRYKKALRKGKSIPCRYGKLNWDGWWMLKPEFCGAFKRPGFSYDSPKRMTCFDAEKKIVMRQTEPTIIATLDTDGFYFPNSIFQCVVKEECQQQVSLHYVLGILNSMLIRRFYLLSSQVEGTTKPQLYINILKSLPFFSATPAEQKPIVSLVQNILEVKQRDAGADVSSLEGKIDQQVYALYGLTREEIKIVEAAAK